MNISKIDKSIWTVLQIWEILWFKYFHTLYYLIFVVHRGKIVVFLWSAARKNGKHCSIHTQIGCDKGPFSAKRCPLTTSFVTLYHNRVDISSILQLTVNPWRSEVNIGMNNFVRVLRSNCIFYEQTFKFNSSFSKQINFYQHWNKKVMQDNVSFCDEEEVNKRFTCKVFSNKKKLVPKTLTFIFNSIF